jgi:hypothetical protein
MLYTLDCDTLKFVLIIFLINVINANFIKTYRVASFIEPSDFF